MENTRESDLDPEILNEVQQRIIEEHRDKPHPPVQKGALKAHMLVHGIVERQVLEKNPPQVIDAIERLTQSGMSRHEVIHLIGKLVTTEALDMIRENREMNLDAYIKALEDLHA